MPTFPRPTYRPPRARPWRRCSRATSSWRTSRSTACAASTDPMTFDLERPWRLGSQVALRPERFGALAYHFQTRRLSFLKSRKLLTVVSTLAEHRSGRDACIVAGVADHELPAYEQALATLARTGMIEERESA